MTTKAGKKPLSSKKIGPSFEGVDFGGSKLDVPTSLKEQLKELGFNCRFISGKRLSEAGGFHHNGWKPLKRSDFQSNGEDVLKLDQYLWGSSPDGTIQRNELVLAIRPTEMSTAHQAHVKKRTDIQAGRHKQLGEEMRRTARQHGLNVQVTEGYEDNE